MEQSADVTALAAALTKAQAKLKGAEKDAKNPHLKSNYASLASVWEACRGPLTENGLSLVQGPAPAAEGFLGLETMLLHESGQWLRSLAFVPLAKSDPQGYGSCMTYARRYSLSAMVGIYPDDDDDGHAASGPRPAANQQQARQEPPRQSAPPAESRGDAAANGDAMTHARTAFDAAFSETWPGAKDERLRLAILSDLTGKQITSVAEWKATTFSTAAARIRALSPQQAAEHLGRAQDAIAPVPAADGSLPLDPDLFNSATDATPRFPSTPGYASH